MKTKEQVYDQEIHPLINQILELCKNSEIQMLTSFTLELNKEKGNLLATTYLGGSEKSMELTTAKNLIVGGLTKSEIVTDYLGNIK